METRANYVLIGAFTLLVLFGAFGFVWWLERVSDAGSRAEYEVVFDGSVSGLRRGSAVNFNGIRVGEVYALALDSNQPDRVIVRIGVASDTPVRGDTKAGLEFQGLTGIASVTLTGGKVDAAALPVEGGVPRLVADSSQTQDLMQATRVLVNRIDALLVENEKRVNEILANLAEFSGDLKTDGKAILSDGKELMASGKEMFAEITETVKVVRATADNLGKAAEPTLVEYQALAKDARRAVGDVSRFVRDLEKNPSQIIWGRGSGTAPAGAARR